MTRYRSHADVQSELVIALHTWWVARADGDIPDRSQLDPADIKPLLPNLLIADVEPQPFRVRYRLVGTKVVAATGLDFTGRYLDQLTPVDTDEPWMAEYRAAFDSRRPVLGVSVIPTQSGALYLYEYGIFPLRDGGSAIAQFISIEDYFDFTRWHSMLDPWKLKP